MKVNVAICRLEHGAGLPLPAYETDGSAGMDLRAANLENQPVELAPGARALIETGLSIALPITHEAQIRPRSGLAIKHGVTCLNTPGTIDSDYRGEIKIILINLGDKPFTVRRGDRIAQMIIAPVTQGNWLEMDELPQSSRGAGGFGSTGNN